MPTQGTKEKTEAELLQTILGSLGEAMAAPDADVQFLQTLQQAIVQHTQQKKQGQQQQVAAAAAMGGGGDMGQGAGGAPGGAAGLGPPPPPNQSELAGRAGPPGLSTMTDPSEVARMLSGSAQG